jgi:hypothetical protein
MEVEGVLPRVEYQRGAKVLHLDARNDIERRTGSFAVIGVETAVYLAPV